MKEVTIVCTLKSGGDYGEKYPMLLFQQIQKHVHVPYRFVCITDKPLQWIGLSKFANLGTRIGLNYNLPAWWSKLEALRLTGPVVSLDLDIVVLGDISDMVSTALDLSNDEVLFLRDFRGVPWNSTMIIRNGDFSGVLSIFLEQAKRGKYHRDKRGVHLRLNDEEFHGDQEWLVPALESVGVTISAIQDQFAGIYSYKDGVRDLPELPEDARIICFHGRPRPHILNPVPDWMAAEGW